jgi:hypothetical protein
LITGPAARQVTGGGQLFAGRTVQCAARSYDEHFFTAAVIEIIREVSATHDMMSGGMMWGMGLVGLLVLILVVLGIVALVKFLSSKEG